MVNEKDMTPWHMYLVMKGVILCKEFDAIASGDNRYRYYRYRRSFLRRAEVSDIAKALLREDSRTFNSLYSLIAMGLDYDACDVTLALYRVSSFEQECNRLNETNKFYPYMAMAASREYKLCHVYDMTMNTCVHNIQREQQQNLGKMYPSHV